MLWNVLENHRRYTPLGIAALVTSVAILSHHFLAEPNHFDLLIYLYPAGFFSVWFGGTLAGVLSVFLGTIASVSFLIYRPVDNFSGHYRHEVFDVCLYIFFGFLFGILIGRERKARKLGLEAIRELKSTAFKLSEREKELNSAVRARDDFFSIASHELKTPITALKLQVQLLERQIPLQLKGELKERFSKAADSMENQISRLTNLVESLLDLTRIAQGTLKLELALIDLAELSREIRERYSTLLNDSGCKVDIYQKGSAMIRSDRFRMEQVFTNLFTNAVKYAPGSTIEISFARTKDSLLIQFKDHGYGIPANQQRQIFAPFRRGTDSKLGVPGLGLGLFIVRQIVQAHGGEIDCHSELGKGTTFDIHLPTEGISSTPYNNLSFDTQTQENINLLHQGFATSFAD
jgi:signal transduction histidine kinase